MIGGDILKNHISVVLSLLFKVPKFFKLSQWRAPILGVWESLVNLINKFTLMYYLMYTSHILFPEMHLHTSGSRA